MIATVTRKLLDKLLRKPYREAYVEENVRSGVAYQIRALREKRGWSQKKLAELLGKPQSVLSRIEDPDYGKLSVQTLLEVASALDVALLVQFATFPEFIERMADVTPGGLNRASFDTSQFQAIDGPPQMVDALRRMNADVICPNVFATLTGAALNSITTGTHIEHVFAVSRGSAAEAALAPMVTWRRNIDAQSAGAVSPEPATGASQPLTPVTQQAWLKALEPNGALH